MNLFKRLRKNGNDKMEKSNNSEAAKNAMTTKSQKENEQNIQCHKYKNPKIMLIDSDPNILIILKEKGYCVTAASLGRPYSVKQESGLHPVVRDAQLPHDYKEQEVIVIDLQYDRKSLKDQPIPEVQNGVDKWWISHKNGYVNPRLLNAEFIRDDFDRILNTGGVFIIFADDYEVQEFFWGHAYGYHDFNQKEKKALLNWNFLSLTGYTNYFKVGSDHGSIIQLNDELSRSAVIVQLMSRFLDDAKYNCTLSPGYSTKDEWTSLLINKFGAAVASAFLPTDKREGSVFIFPKFQNKAEFIVAFIDEFLPTLAPNLFPEIETASWVNQPEYELPSVVALRNQVVEIREKARSDIESLEKEIHTQKEQSGYLYDLIRETGDTLVAAVYKSFTILGYKNVIDVDEEIKKEGVQGQNREDLQIQDYGPTLIVEVKGISHHPSDDDALTVQKYVVLRMREWGRVNVKGLSVINHQRHLPPLFRDNEMPFRKEIIVAADEQEVGLITGWDLHRLVRSYIANRWKHENVSNILYRSGRIDLRPSHYEFLGTIERFFDKISVVVIKLAGSIQKGELIAFELPVIFKEETCDSLQFENENIDEAHPGMIVGLKTTLTKEEAKRGVNVFRVVN